VVSGSRQGLKPPRTPSTSRYSFLQTPASRPAASWCSSSSSPSLSVASWQRRPYGGSRRVEFLFTRFAILEFWASGPAPSHHVYPTVCQWDVEGRRGGQEILAGPVRGAFYVFQRAADRTEANPQRAPCQHDRLLNRPRRVSVSARCRVQRLIVAVVSSYRPGRPSTLPDRAWRCLPTS